MRNTSQDQLCNNNRRWRAHLSQLDSTGNSSKIMVNNLIQTINNLGLLNLIQGHQAEINGAVTRNLNIANKKLLNGLNQLPEGQKDNKHALKIIVSNHITIIHLLRSNRLNSNTNRRRKNLHLSLGYQNLQTRIHEKNNHGNQKLNHNKRSNQSNGQVLLNLSKRNHQSNGQAKHQARLSHNKRNLQSSGQVKHHQIIMQIQIAIQALTHDHSNSKVTNQINTSVSHMYKLKHNQLAITHP